VNTAWAVFGGMECVGMYLHNELEDWLLGHQKRLRFQTTYIYAFICG
jgi:hypothetical protein